jgi:hypothetical protein
MACGKGDTKEIVAFIHLLSAIFTTVLDSENS